MLRKSIFRSLEFQRACIDKRLIEKLLGCELSGQKDKYQRESCGCLESVEVGTYNSVSMVVNIAMQISMKQR
mgnify:CR=1 FL=1